MTTLPPTIRRPAAGFTLMETLLAMGIFLIGVIAVAAVFPTAITVQKATVDDLTSQIIARNARNQMVALAADGTSGPANQNDGPFTYHHDNSPGSRTGTLANYTTDLRVKSLVNFDHGGYGPGSADPQEVVGPTTGTIDSDITDALSAELLSYPSTIPTVAERPYRWFPLIKVDGLGTGSIGWRVFVMICRAPAGGLEPAVYSFDATEYHVSGSPGDLGQFELDPAVNNDPNNDGLPDYIRPGDWVLADNGLAHRIVLVEGDIVTVDSPTVSSGPVPPSKLFFAALRDVNTGLPQPNLASPIVRIDEFQLPVMDREP